MLIIDDKVGGEEGREKESMYYACSTHCKNFTVTLPQLHIYSFNNIWYSSGTQNVQYVGYPSRNVRDRVDCNHLAHNQDVEVTFLAVYLSHMNFLPQQTLLWTL